MKKYASKTYLKNVTDLDLKIYSKRDNYSIVVKRILNIKEPFFLNEMGNDIKLLDNNYYILEYIPFNKNYFCRLFIDENKEIKEYYYQFTEKQGIEYSIPHYSELNIAYVKTQYGEKIYNPKKETISKKILEIINNKELEFNLDYKKYL